MLATIFALVLFATSPTAVVQTGVNGLVVDATVAVSTVGNPLSGGDDWPV